MKKTLVKKIADFIKDKDAVKTWQVRGVDRKRPDSAMRTLRYLKEKFYESEMSKGELAYVFDRKDHLYYFSPKFKFFLKKIG